jgi:hypothetical protein
MSPEPDRIGSQKSNRPSATFSGVDGLSAGDEACVGSGANGDASAARGRAVHAAAAIHAAHTPASIVAIDRPYIATRETQAT